jgi:hypothetical protein
VLLWRLAFLRRLAPRRSVRAATDGLVLCIRPCDVDERVCADPAFRARFLRLVSDFAREHGAGRGPGPAQAKPLASAQVPQVIEKLLLGDLDF